MANSMHTNGCAGFYMYLGFLVWGRGLEVLDWQRAAVVGHSYLGGVWGHAPSTIFFFKFEPSESGSEAF